MGGGGERQTEDWYKEKGIEVHLADPVASIDLVAQNVTTKSGRRVTYEKLVVAIGCGYVHKIVLVIAYIVVPTFAFQVYQIG